MEYCVSFSRLHGISVCVNPKAHGVSWEAGRPLERPGSCGTDDPLVCVRDVASPELKVPRPTSYFELIT